MKTFEAIRADGADGGESVTLHSDALAVCERVTTFRDAGVVAADETGGMTGSAGGFLDRGSCETVFGLILATDKRSSAIRFGNG